MSDLKLFRLDGGIASELPSTSAALEKSLQTTIENNMETLFGVRLLASEYSTGARHRGRMDSLGIDENGSPVIFEYKRALNENVINQGLFYLDWLMDHHGAFEMLILNHLGNDTMETVDWRNPRLICVANGFTRYDEYAVQQINRSIELVRYRNFGDDLLALELITGTTADTASNTPPPKQEHGGTDAPSGKTVSEYLQQAPQDLRDLYEAADAFCRALGDDVTSKTLKNYFAYRRLKNFACIEVHPQSKNLLVYLKVDPDTVALEPDFSRDVRSIGHFGTGDLELRVRTPEDLERAQPLIQRAYDEG